MTLNKVGKIVRNADCCVKFKDNELLNKTRKSFSIS